MSTKQADRPHRIAWGQSSTWRSLVPVPAAVFDAGRNAPPGHGQLHEVARAHLVGPRTTVPSRRRTTAKPRSITCWGDRERAWTPSASARPRLDWSCAAIGRRQSQWSRRRWHDRRWGPGWDHSRRSPACRNRVDALCRPAARALLTSTRPSRSRPSSRRRSIEARRRLGPAGQFGLQLVTVGYHRMGRYGGRAAPEVRHLVAQRAVGLVAYGGHDGHGAGSHGPAQLFVAPGQQGSGVPAPPGQDQYVDPRPSRQPFQGVDDAQRRPRAANRRFLHVKGIAGEARRYHRLDVLAHRRLRPAQDTDHPGQARQRPPLAGQARPLRPAGRGSRRSWPPPPLPRWGRLRPPPGQAGLCRCPTPGRRRP